MEQWGWTMLAFCGVDKCSLDANGRIKLSPRFVEDFRAAGGDLVLHCLPEGALALYPEAVYLEMRRKESSSASRAGESMMYRRMLRAFGAMSRPEKISPQGRITLPLEFREHAKLRCLSELALVGVEIGVEIWSAERWMEEQRKIQEHLLEKGRLEMMSDLGEGVLPGKNGG